MGLLGQALDDGWTLIDGATCAQRAGGVLQANVGQCPCASLDRGCPVRLALDGDDVGHVMLLDARHRIVGLNRAAPGLTVDDVLGTRPYDRPEMAPAAREAMRGGLQRAATNGCADSFDLAHIRPNGERVTWAGAVTPLVDPRGGITGFRLELATVAAAKRSSGVSWAPVRIAT